MAGLSRPFGSGKSPSRITWVLGILGTVLAIGVAGTLSMRALTNPSHSTLAAVQVQTNVRCTYSDGSTIMLEYGADGHAASINAPGVVPSLGMTQSSQSGGAQAGGGFIPASAKASVVALGSPTMTGWDEIASQDDPAHAMHVAAGFGWSCTELPSAS
jgi:hypothetical protein